MQILFDSDKTQIMISSIRIIQKLFLCSLPKKNAARLNSVSLSLMFYFLLFFPKSGFAQVSGDGTINTVVDYKDQTYTVSGGVTAGKNLFHSFSEFSIPTRKEVFFNNLSTVNNIITRVTGSSISTIDGSIRANCCANLFFLNPNGIVFGSNASLNVGGSFFGTTASSITFANGSIFSVSNSQDSSLLSVDIPAGLQFRASPGTILVKGVGHDIVDPYASAEPSGGLQVKSGQTLALVGGSINLEGGILSAKSGSVALGSVNSGIVSINHSLIGWSLDYKNVTHFQDILLSKKSLVDASGKESGSIHVQGANITLLDGSLMLIQHENNQIKRGIEVKATDSINIIGSALSQNGLIPSGIIDVNFGSEDSSDINISSPQLLLKKGGSIQSATLGTGKGSRINVNAFDSLQLIESLGNENQTLIVTYTGGDGRAGDVSISTTHLNLLNGGAIGSGTFAAGDSGNVDVISSEDISVSGVVLNADLNSTISSVTTSSGNSGNLNIKTKELKVLDGATIVVSTYAEGNAGTLTINASDSVLLSGSSTDKGFVSGVASAARFESATGSTGNIKINTPKLTIRDGAGINISHDGDVGNAGSLTINTGSIVLDREGFIKADTKSGVGGNINIFNSNILLMRNNSFIAANAGGSGDGGNISVQSPFLVSFPNENNDIIANSLTGSGGRVEISATGIFGLAPRSREELQRLLGTTDPTKLDPRLLKSNDITAISQSSPSLNGLVKLNTPEVDLSKGLVELPTTVVDPKTLVTQNPCRRASSSEFTRSGRGGLPPSLSQDLNSDSTQVGLVEPANFGAEKPEPKSDSKQASSLPPSSSQIVPAQGWVYNDKGEVVLVAYNSTVTGPQRLQSAPKGCPVL
jgi:filamentous hemagglutinin family protein